MLGKTILTDTVTEILHALNNMPLPLAKKYLKVNYHSVQSLHKIEIFEDENKVCLVHRKYRFITNTKVIPLVISTNGITYDKTTRKLKVWIGTKLQHLPLLQLFDYLGYNWINNFSDYDNYKNIIVLDLLTTKSIVEKILNGTITNPKLLIKYYIKISIKYKYNWRIVRDYLNCVGSRLSNKTSHLINISKYTYNPNETLSLEIMLYHYTNILREMISKRDNVILEDFWDNCQVEALKLHHINNVGAIYSNFSKHIELFQKVITNASYLGIKINSKWSTKRLVNEIRLQEEKLLDFEELVTSDKCIVFPSDVELLPDSYIICSENELFRRIRDCKEVGSSIGELTSVMWRRCKSGVSLSLVLNNPYNAVVEIVYNKNKLEIGMCHTRVKDAEYVDLKSIVNEWLNTVSTKLFFNRMKEEPIEVPIDGSYELATSRQLEFF